MIVGAWTLRRQALGMLGAPISQKGAMYSEERYAIRGAQCGQRGIRLLGAPDCRGARGGQNDIMLSNGHQVVRRATGD